MTFNKRTAKRKRQPKPNPTYKPRPVANQNYNVRLIRAILQADIKHELVKIYFPKYMPFLTYEELYARIQSMEPEWCPERPLFPTYMGKLALSHFILEMIEWQHKECELSLGCMAKLLKIRKLDLLYARRQTIAILKRDGETLQPRKASIAYILHTKFVDDGLRAFAKVR